MIKITATVTDEASPVLRRLENRMSGASLLALQSQAGLAAKDAAAAYHREFNRGGGWTDKGYMQGRSGTARGFGERVAQGWKLESHTGSGSVISNAAEYYYLKVYGQTLKPKKGGYFTEPLVAGLNGVTPEEYTRRTGRALFKVKGQTALFERLESNAPRSGGRAGSPKNAPMRAVFSLVKSIRHDPWKGAFPPVDRLASAYQKELGKAVAEAVDGVQ